MGSHQPIRPIRKTVEPEPPLIPDKLYFRIGEVAKLCGVESYVLRFWQTEFPTLKPTKGGAGQRLYRRKDVEMALRIKGLLYDQGFTIPGARQALKTDPGQSAPSHESVILSGARSAEPKDPEGLHLAENVSPFPAKASPSKLLALRDELHSLAHMLARPVATAPQPPRPRLVLAPKPETKLHALKPKLEQGDLFGEE